MRRRVVSRSESSSSSGPRTARDPKNGLAAGGAEMRMRQRVAPTARTRPMVPVEPTAVGAALYSAVQLRRSPRTAHGPSWSRCRRCPAEHAALCRSCGVADGVVNQVGPSDTAHVSSELVKASTPRSGRPSYRNTPPGGLVGAASWSRSGTSPLPLRTRQVSFGEVLVLSWIQPTWASGEVLQPDSEASGPRRRPT
jgi:hypothetical protein